MTYKFIPGQSDDTPEEETLAMIRAVLTEDAPEKPSRKQAHRMPAPVPDTPMALVQKAFDETMPNLAPRRGSADLPELESEIVEAPAKWRTLPDVTNLKSLAERVRAFRPTPRHLAIVSVLLLLVVRPFWFLFGIVLFVGLVMAAFLILGSERIWRGVDTRLKKVARHDTQRATTLRIKLDRFAFRWDAILDHFPDGMVDGLYMPDLQAADEAEDAHQVMVSDRLNRMAQEN